MSIASGYRGTVTVSNATIQQLNIRSSLFTLMRSDLTIDLLSVRDLSRDIDALARFLSIESDSSATITNSEFYDISFSLISVTDSTVSISDTYIQNVTALQYLIE